MFKRGGFCALCALLCAGLLAGCRDTVPAVVMIDGTENWLPSDAPEMPIPPIINTESEPPETEAETAPDEPLDACTQKEVRIEVPSPIGMHIDALAEMPFPEGQILIERAYYPLPAGMVFDVTFEGEQEGELLYVAPESLLTLHVSDGIDPKNVTVSPEDKTVYLTFDDGPSKVNTLSVLDVLDEYGVKATFFLVGEFVEKYPHIVCEIHARGHKIGCHSFTHRYDEIYANAENMKAEILRWEAAVESALGFVPEERLFRFPGGSSTCKEDGIRQMLAEEGFRAYDWNAVTGDCMLHTRPVGMTEEEYMQKSVIETLAYSFRLKTCPHIVLMHDTYVQTADLLPWMIEYMMEQGCTFGTLDALASGWLHSAS